MYRMTSKQYVAQADDNNNHSAEHGNGDDDDKLQTKIDPDRNRFPFCLVWGPLPLITWVLPFIGHMGIGDSAGRVHDFAGPYYIGVDNFMVGNVTKYIQLDPRRIKLASRSDDGGDSENAGSSSSSEGQGLSAVAAADTSKLEEAARLWNEGIAQADRDYEKQMHNICCNNCHHHAACAIRKMKYDRNMSMIQAWWLITTRGRYVSWGRLLQTYLPFLIIVALIVILRVVLGR